MSKFIQAFLTGIFITFIQDFFIFLGIKQNYINFYEIDVYYNILFADHQNIIIFMICSFILGALVIYINNTKLSIITLSIISLLSVSTIIPSIGHKVGELLLMKKNVTYKNSKYTFIGDAYYVGRKKITFYDYELKKIILLDKKELK